jgi:hypothetical protein
MEMISIVGSLQIRVQGTPGVTYIVEASDDLIVWGPVGTNSATLEGLLFTDAASTNFAHGSTARGLRIDWRTVRAVWPAPLGSRRKLPDGESCRSRPS